MLRGPTSFPRSLVGHLDGMRLNGGLALFTIQVTVDTILRHVPNRAGTRIAPEHFNPQAVCPRTQQITRVWFPTLLGAPLYSTLHLHHLSPCRVRCGGVGCVARHQKLAHTGSRSMASVTGHTATLICLSGPVRGSPGTDLVPGQGMDSFYRGMPL